MTTLELKTKEKLAEAARTLAASFQLVNHNSKLYLPVDYTTRRASPPPDPRNRVWRSLDLNELKLLANQTLRILFANESEVINFRGMLMQLAQYEAETPDFILLYLPESGLAELHSDGRIVTEVTGNFTPNFMSVPLNRDAEKRKFVWNTIVEWVGGEENAHSLLHHVATALAPDWSAAKYVLLLGEGRNGKGVFLEMVKALFGNDNVSNVTRQQMAESSPVCAELNNMMLNIVMDGSAKYVGDSGMEKTLTVGEEGSVRKLYESGLTTVQTNALFMEGLNSEPRTRDKSPALQKRLTRFWFPNVYAANPRFSKHMRSKENLGAFLALLLDHFVTEDEVAEKLAPTQQSTELQMDQMLHNSLMLQFLADLAGKDPDAITKLLGSDAAIVVSSFVPWAHSQEGTLYSDADALRMVRDAFVVKRSTRRNETPRNYQKIAALKPETQTFISLMEGESNEPDTVVVAES